MASKNSPPAANEKSGRGGYTLACEYSSWFGSGIQLAASNALQTDDDSGGAFDAATDEDTVVYLAQTTNNGGTITLSTSDAQEGRVIIVTDQDGNAGSNNVTIDTEGSGTIDGSASATISTNNGTVRLVSDGTDWFTI